MTIAIHSFWWFLWLKIWLVIGLITQLMSLFLSKPAILNKDKEQLKLAWGEHCLAFIG